MRNVTIQDYGVPIPRAAAISGLDRGVFTTFMFRGLLGPSPSGPVDKISLRHVAAAMALAEARDMGVSREQLDPVLDEIADAAYVRLAMLEISLRRWHTVTSGTDLLRKLRSEDGQAELEELLAVGTRNTKRFAVFSSSGTVVTNSTPEDSETAKFIDAWRIAELIQARAPGTLFY